NYYTIFSNSIPSQTCLYNSTITNDAFPSPPLDDGNSIDDWSPTQINRQNHTTTVSLSSSQQRIDSLDYIDPTVEIDNMLVYVDSEGTELLSNIHKMNLLQTSPHQQEEIKKCDKKEEVVIKTEVDQYNDGFEHTMLTNNNNNRYRLSQLKGGPSTNNDNSDV